MAEVVMIRIFLTIGLVLVSLLFYQNAHGQSWEDLLNTSDSLIETQNLDSAVAIGKLALQRAEEEYGDEDTTVAMILHRLADYYLSTFFLQHYDEAEAFMKRSLAIRKKIHGDEHPDVAASLLQLAVLYMNHRYFAEAEPLFLRSQAIYEKTLGLDNQETIMCLRQMGSFYFRQNKYLEAEQYCQKALDAGERIFGPDHRNMAPLRIELGIMYFYQAKFRQAEASFLQAIGIREKVDGQDHPNVATALGSLARTYIMEGRYADAEPVQERALAIREKAFGPNHSDVALSLCDLGDVYRNQGKYTQAEAALKRALEINEQTLERSHPNVAWNLNSLGIIYMDQEMYPLAEKYLERALDIMERIIGPERIDVTSSMNTLATVYSYQGKIDKAEELFKRSLEIKKNALTPDHPSLALSLHNLGCLYLDQGKYAQSEEYLERAYTIWEKTLGPDNHNMAAILQHQSKLKRSQGDGGAAINLAKRAFDIRKKNFSDNAGCLTEKDAITYSQFIRLAMDQYLTAYTDFEHRDSATDIDAADIALSYKGRISDEIFWRQKALIEETDSATLALAESLRLVKYQLSRLFVRGPGEDVEKYRQTVDSMNIQVDELDADLAQHSASFLKQKDIKNISADRVRTLLPEQSTLIEYLKYNHHFLHPDSVTSLYLAIVLTHDNAPAIINLGSAFAIDSLVERYRKHMLRVSGYGKLIDDDRDEYEKISSDLYSKVWLPLEKHLTGEDLVLIAPDAALNMVSFAGLTNKNGSFLVENFAIHYLSCGRDLIRLRDKEVPAKGLFALGDPDYNAPIIARQSESQEMRNTSSDSKYYAAVNLRSSCFEFEEMLLSPLPATRSEVERILANWLVFTDEPVGIYIGPDASEEKFKSEAPHNRVVHLATHGYFLGGECWPDMQDSKFYSTRSYAGENPLLLSGLFLSGANLCRQDFEGMVAEDGVLTAYEVSAMDFSGTELVVLSACETGLGKVEQGEGVYGLRRAFQIAGAETVVSALWPVSDKWTARLMGRLYDHNVKTLPERIQNLQLDVINELRNQGKSDHPISWGAFISQGDWR
jgi:CHAT domain-containing protein/Tfp pilus assembly protein PilF